MENEENKEVQAVEAPKPVRPKKRHRSVGFDATEVKESPIVDPAPQPTEEDKLDDPIPVPVAAEPVPVRSKPVAKAPTKPAATPAAPTRKARVARPLKRNPQGDGTQRGIRNRG